MTVHICDKRKSILEATGHCLVMGGPGSGKTTLALLKAVARMGKGLSPGQEVLFLSFSRAAVARIADAAKTQVPLRERSCLSIETFHSFFWRILKGHGYLLGCPRQLSILLPHDEKAMSNGIERGSLFWPDWERRRRQMFHADGRVPFDLFAPLAADILARAKRIRDRVAAKYPLILVDEAQDTGTEQWQCVRLLADKSQVVCLADPNQMIYDFLPGVGPSRISEIRDALRPHEINLEHENHRSPGTEIAAFARDILAAKVRGAPYKGVSRQRFHQKATNRDAAIRSSVGIPRKRILDETGRKPESIAVIASYTSGVAVISKALQTGTPIPHQVLFDEAFAILSSRAAAFLLEPKDVASHTSDVAAYLDLAGAAFRAKGNKGSLDLSAKCVGYAARCRAGAVPKVKIAEAASNLVTSARGRSLTGIPGEDWLSVRQDMKRFGETAINEMASSLEYLVAFARGHRISEELSSL